MNPCCARAGGATKEEKKTSAAQKQAKRRTTIAAIRNAPCCVSQSRSPTDLCSCLSMIFRYRGMPPRSSVRT